MGQNGQLPHGPDPDQRPTKRGPVPNGLVAVRNAAVLGVGEVDRRNDRLAEWHGHVSKAQECQQGQTAGGVLHARDARTAAQTGGEALRGPAVPNTLRQSVEPQQLPQRVSQNLLRTGNSELQHLRFPPDVHHAGTGERPDRKRDGTACGELAGDYQQVLRLAAPKAGHSARSRPQGQRRWRR